jgi:hypothetical protein
MDNKPVQRNGGDGGGKRQAKTPRERMQARRDRLRAQGLRPVQHWVPDLRDPRVRAAIRRDAALLSQHPDNAALDDWLDAVHDSRDWP